MAKAKKLPSGSWRVQVYDCTDADGKKRYASFTSGSKKEAEFLAAEFKLNKTGKKDISSLTFGEALDKYIDSHSSVLSPATIREYKSMRKRDMEALEYVKLSGITQDLVQDFVNSKAAKLSPKTVKNIHGLVSSTLKAYRPDIALHTNLPKKVRPTIRVPSDADIRTLMAAVEGTEMEIPILLAAFGPMRRGEICALSMDHVKGNNVHVEYAMVLDDAHNWVIKPPKSFAGNRVINFPDFVIAKLPAAGRVTNLYPSQISNRFIDIVKKLDIPPFRFHDLRHYNASISHAIGIPDQYIMQRGGWGSDAVLKNVYRHAMEEQEKAMNTKANDYFSGLLNPEDNQNITRNTTQNKKPT